MPRILAIEWDDEELRVVAASKRRATVRIEHAFNEPLAGPVVLPDDSTEGGRAPDDPEASGEVASLEMLSASELGKRIAAALSEHGVGRGETLVAVSRSQVELRQMTFPPAEDADLPDMVRFQFEREFAHIGADWLIDYLPLDNDPAQPRKLLVAAMPPGTRQHIEEVCQAAGLKMARLLLRPTGAASVVRRCQPEAGGGVQLLVDLLTDEVDLTVMMDERIVFMRTARLAGKPLDPGGSTLTLQSEIRRTMAAAHNQLGGSRVENIVLLGATERHEQLAEKLGKQVQTPVVCCDPLAAFEKSPELVARPPRHPGRCAPLLGMAADHLDATAPELDFLHPHRPPEPPSQRNRLALAGLAAGLLILLGVAYAWHSMRALDDRLRTTQAEINKVEKELEAAKEMRELATAVENWRRRDFCWLDEIDRVCRLSPGAEQVMLTKLSMAAQQSGGQMQLDGLARDVSAIQALEKALHDQRHSVVSKDKSYEESQPPYTLRFSTVVGVQPVEEETQQ